MKTWGGWAWALAAPEPDLHPRELPVNLLLYGASGMVGQGVLREAVRDPEVARVVIVGRSTAGATDPKARETLADDLTDVSAVGEELHAIDACVFCLGVSAAGLSESAYRRVTFDLTLAIARTLARTDP
jgi:uncharacterized protein YbjT (DUF2867 family)